MVRVLHANPVFFLRREKFLNLVSSVCSHDSWTSSDFPDDRLLLYSANSYRGSTISYCSIYYRAIHTPTVKTITVKTTTTTVIITTVQPVTTVKTATVQSKTTTKKQSTTVIGQFREILCDSKFSFFPHYSHPPYIGCLERMRCVFLMSLCWGHKLVYKAWNYLTVPAQSTVKLCESILLVSEDSGSTLNDFRFFLVLQ
jgi:hypothetical protein